MTYHLYFRVSAFIVLITLAGVMCLLFFLSVAPSPGQTSTADFSVENFITLCGISPNNDNDESKAFNSIITNGTDDRAAELKSLVRDSAALYASYEIAKRKAISEEDFISAQNFKTKIDELCKDVSLKVRKLYQL
jgi:hypothetical protein